MFNSLFIKNQGTHVNLPSEFKLDRINRMTVSAVKETKQQKVGIMDGGAAQITSRIRVSEKTKVPSLKESIQQQGGRNFNT